MKKKNIWLKKRLNIFGLLGGLGVLAVKLIFGG
jgi:hypothetical protein